MTIRLVVLIALLVASGCGGQVDSGVRGTVTAGPTCAGPVRVGQSCSDRSVAVRLKAIRFPRDFVGVPMPQYGRVVARFTSGADGRFRVALPPGEYLLYGAPRPAFIDGCQDSVTVPAHRWVRTHVECGTGLE